MNNNLDLYLLRYNKIIGLNVLIISKYSKNLC